MPHPPKYFDPLGVYIVTSRTEEGLPFIDAARWKPIFESILARGQELYPVVIGQYYLGANQLHMLVQPIVPEDLSAFMGYIKQELAHHVNIERGRRKKTVWSEGYDSPILLGYEEALHYANYILTQPVKDAICHRVADYKGANSYNNLVAGVSVTRHKRVYRRNTPDTEAANEESVLRIDHFFWVKSLGRGVTESEAKSALLSCIETIENETYLERKKNGIKLKGPISNPDSYVPRKFGKRMRCICRDIMKRVKFLSWMKECVARCREVYQRWKSGDHSQEWPAGFFAPSRPIRVCAIPREAVLDIIATHF